MSEDHEKRARKHEKRDAFERERDSPWFVEKYYHNDSQEYQRAFVENEIYIYHRQIIQDNVRDGIARADCRVEIGVISHE